MTAAGFFDNGWCRFAADPALRGWLDHALPAASAAVADPRHAHWLRCDGTWFAGVNVLDNDARGRVGNSPPLCGAAVEFIADVLGLTTPDWDRGQISVIFPGYPRKGTEESEAAAAFRLNRDAAHVDGLLPIGPERARKLREPHGFVLGIPMNDTPPDAAPLVVWQGSHEIMRRAFAAALAPYPPHDWPEVDLSAAYHAARRDAFARCQRVTVHARPGEAYLVHRLALHGVAPWAEGATGPSGGRMICYFRPQLPGGAGDWLAQP